MEAISTQGMTVEELGFMKCVRKDTSNPSVDKSAARVILED